MSEVGTWEIQAFRKIERVLMKIDDIERFHIYCFCPEQGDTRQVLGLDPRLHDFGQIYTTRCNNIILRDFRKSTQSDKHALLSKSKLS